MINELRCYITDCLDPYQNLATEKYLLDNIPRHCCGMYLWQNQNTVVIGQNQNAWAECRCSLLQEEGGKLARRLSGGGSVFHDLGNLNFTFICSSENFDITRQMQTIQKACRLAGISAEISGRNDILADGRKFSGNAFYNSKGRSYHHGTLLISADIEKLERYLTPPKAKLDAKGVKSVKSRVVNLSELAPDLTCHSMKDYMISAFSEVYGLPVQLCKTPSTEETSQLAQKYASWEYLYGSPLPFTFSAEEHFPWGNIELKLDVKSGVIRSVQVYTDCMDWTLPDMLKEALSGSLFRLEEMEKAINSRLPANQAEDICALLKKQEI